MPGIVLLPEILGARISEDPRSRVSGQILDVGSREILVGEFKYLKLMGSSKSNLNIKLCSASSYSSSFLYFLVVKGQKDRSDDGSRSIPDNDKERQTPERRKATAT
jgi:hypothetical protein